MKKREYEDDDGRVIADMNIDGFKWYNKNLGTQNPNLNKKEKKVLRLSAYMSGLIMFAIIAAAFGIAMFLAWLWLH